MKTRNRKRYHNRFEIERDIDKFKLKAQKLMDSAASLDLIADQLRDVDSVGHREQIAFNRNRAEKNRAAALRIEKRKLVQLKQKLAEFMTPPLPGSGITDNTIQAT